MKNLPFEQIYTKIYSIREQKVMLDSELAEIYQVNTSYLNRQVKRNIECFDSDFMFELTHHEFEILKCQNGTSSWGGRRKLPLVFTEEGVYMLATVINSDVAIETTKGIMRTFTKLREFSLSYENLIKEIHSIKEDNHLPQVQTNENIKLALEYLQEILEESKKIEEKVMGFKP